MDKTTDALKLVTQADLAALAVDHIAYVKSVSNQDDIAYAIHAADGTELAVMADRDVAFAAVRQNGMEPVSVH